jgi:hypothetical protein
MISKLVSAFLYLLLIAALCSAAVLEVPDEFPRIKDAIADSEAGDTVLVAPGVYYENLVFTGKNILLASEFIYDSSWQTVAATIIDGSQSEDDDSGTVIVFNKGESEACHLTGFTIRGGYGTLMSTGYFGGGILCTNNSNPTISYNAIQNNNAISGGGGAFINSKPKFYFNLVRSNSAIRGAGLSLDNSKAYIDRSVFSFNNASDSAGAIYIRLSSNVIIKNSVFYKNNNQTETPSGGIGCYNSFPYIGYNDFYDNSGGDFGNCNYNYGDTSCCKNFNRIPCDSFFNIFRYLF